MSGCQKIMDVVIQIYYYYAFVIEEVKLTESILDD